MRTEEKKKPGPKPQEKRQGVKHLLIRDVPVDLREKAKIQAAIRRITFREYAIEALTEKVAARY